MVRMSTSSSQKSARARSELALRVAVESAVNPNRILLEIALLFVVLGSACASAGSGRPTTPQRETVEMEELRITAKRGEQGYEFAAYDAADLFKRATEL